MTVLFHYAPLLPHAVLLPSVASVSSVLKAFDGNVDALCCLLWIRRVALVRMSLAAFIPLAHHFVQLLLLIGRQDRTYLGHRAFVNLFHFGTTVLLRCGRILARVLHLF